MIEPPPGSNLTPYDVNQLDREGVSLLHWAAINNNFRIVKYFLSKGAIIDRIGGNQQATPLHWAIRKHLLEMVGLLMHFGADPMIQDIQGMNCLHVAAMEGATSIILYLLAKGMDVNWYAFVSKMHSYKFSCRRYFNYDCISYLIKWLPLMNMIS